MKMGQNRNAYLYLELLNPFSNYDTAETCLKLNK